MSGLSSNESGLAVEGALFWLSDSTVDSLEDPFEDSTTVGFFVPFAADFGLLRNETNFFKCLMYSG